MYKEAWIIMLTLGVLLLFISMLLFFIWGIPDLVDEISGRKAKRQIKLMRDINSTTSNISKFSTDEIYHGIPSGNFLHEEIPNMDIEVKDGDSDSNEEFDKSLISDDLEATSFLDKDDIETTYLGVDSNNAIIILEEQSSL